MQSKPSFKILPVQLKLLKAFMKPSDITRISTWYWEIAYVSNPELLVNEWISSGLLLPAKLEDVLNKEFQIAQLKEFLQKYRLSVSGNKTDLIKRLLEHDLSGMRQVVSNNQFFQCSSEAVKLIEDCNRQFNREIDIAKQKCFELFAENKTKEACKIYIAYERYFNNPDFQVDHRMIQKVQCASNANPPAMSVLPSESMQVIKSSVCMKYLWGKNTIYTIEWLTSNLGIPSQDIQKYIRYIEVNTGFKFELEDIKHKINLYGVSHRQRVEFLFHPGDVESCELCLSLRGQIFDVDNAPELPMAGCDSESGCRCSILRHDEYGAHFEGDLEEFDDDFDENVDEEETSESNNNETSGRENPLVALRTLKRLLDENLITTDEYNQKKAEILSRL